MKKLLIATTNHGKFKEYQYCFRDTNIELKSVRDFPNIGEIEETGTTYKENAILKVKTCYEKTGIPSLGDDGGFEVDYLGGFPGLHSNRWLGPEATDYDKACMIMEKMKGVPRENRSARLGSYMVFWDGARLFESENWVYGYIPEEENIKEVHKGFPYKSVLFVPEFGKLYKDLTEEEDVKVNHRIRNAFALKERVLELVNGINV